MRKEGEPGAREKGGELPGGLQGTTAAGTRGGLARRFAGG